MVGPVTLRLLPLIKLTLKELIPILLHSTMRRSFVSLVAPVTWEATFAFVVVGQAANLGFCDLQGSLVVNVFVVSRTKVVDDGDSLAHEVHHILGVATGHVVFFEDLADAHSKDQTDVGNGVLVP